MTMDIKEITDRLALLFRDNPEVQVYKEAYFLIGGLSLTVKTFSNIIEQHEKEIQSLRLKVMELQEAMTTKPVKGIKITKDGKVKTVATYRDASAAIRARKSQKRRVVKAKPR